MGNGGREQGVNKGELQRWGLLEFEIGEFAEVCEGEKLYREVCEGGATSCKDGCPLKWTLSRCWRSYMEIPDIFLGFSSLFFFHFFMVFHFFFFFFAYLLWPGIVIKFSRMDISIESFFFFKIYFQLFFFLLDLG